MSDDFEKRIRDLESSLSYAKGFAAAFGAVGIGVGALAIFAFSKAQDAIAVADLIDAKKPVLISEIANEAKKRLSWKRIDLKSKDNFNDECLYRFTYRNPHSDLVVEYAVEVAGKTLSGAITSTRFFNVQAGNREKVFIMGTDSVHTGEFDIDWIEEQCITTRE